MLGLKTICSKEWQERDGKFVPEGTEAAPLCDVRQDLAMTCPRPDEGDPFLSLRVWKVIDVRANLVLPFRGRGCIHDTDAQEERQTKDTLLVSIATTYCLHPGILLSLLRPRESL